jgi:hypothetical protein
MDSANTKQNVSKNLPIKEEKLTKYRPQHFPEIY